MSFLTSLWVRDRIRKREAEKKANYGNEYGFWGPKREVVKDTNTWGTPMLGRYVEKSEKNKSTENLWNRKPEHTPHSWERKKK